MKNKICQIVANSLNEQNNKYNLKLAKLARTKMSKTSVKPKIC